MKNIIIIISEPGSDAVNYYPTIFCKINVRETRNPKVNNRKPNSSFHRILPDYNIKPTNR